MEAIPKKGSMGDFTQSPELDATVLLLSAQFYCILNCISQDQLYYGVKAALPVVKLIIKAWR